MSRFRVFLLGLLTVFAVFCTSPGNIPIVHELVLGSGGISILAGTLGGAEAKLQCTTGNIHGKQLLLGAGSGRHSFFSCKFEKPAGCKLSAAQESKLEASFIYQEESATLALLTGAGTSEEFVSLEIENKPGETCVVTGTFPITGRQMVEMPTGGEGKVNQEIVAKKSESFLKFGGNAASLSFKVEIHLGGSNIGSAWLVMTGE
jgi:hypothetical protein